MKTAAIVLGIAGGVVGLAGTALSLLAGGLGEAFPFLATSSGVELRWAALAFSIMGILGGALAGSKPSTAGLAMVAAGLGGLMSVAMAYAVAAPLLIAAGILASLCGESSGEATKAVEGPP
ncbi:MAG: hypothetical protein Q8O76_10135 [Chloroflexota bacterium]|nr:hypothetical protein [Chloroflexota bacterium]